MFSNPNTESSLANPIASLENSSESERVKSTESEREIEWNSQEAVHCSTSIYSLNGDKALLFSFIYLSKFKGILQVYRQKI